MIRSGLNFCLGTDTANSSNHLDILRTANLLLLISKDFAMDPKILNAQRAFDMVTAEGGSCLSLGSDEALGRIEPGREADIAIFDLDNLEWFSETDPIQWLLYGSTPKTHATIVSGKIAYAEGRFSLGSSLQKIMQQCRKRAIRIRDSINHQTD